MENNITSKQLKEELDRTKKEILEGVREILTTHLQNQELYIERRMEEINFWSKFSENKHFDMRLKAIEKHLDLPALTS